MKPNGTRSAYCPACRTARKQAYQRIYRKQHRERFRAYERAFRERIHSDAYLTEKVRQRNRENARKLRETHPERYRKADQRTYWRLRNDPARWAQWLADQRERAKDRRLRDGLPIRLASGNNGGNGGWTPAGVGAPNGPQLDAMPLRLWLRREFGGWPIHELARWLGEDDRHLGRLLNGTQQSISLHVADRIFVHADCTHLLSVLYPEDGS